MIKKSPHLPNPTCSVKSHQAWERIRLILIVTFFACFAGIVGASIGIAWIWPQYGGGDLWVINQQNKTFLSRSQLEEKIKLDLQNKILSIYTKVKSVNGVEYFDEKDKIGDGVPVSSDGWIVFYFPKITTLYSINTIKSWQFVQDKNILYKASEVKYDDYTELVYVKLLEKNSTDPANQLRIVSFLENVDILNDIFVFENKNWQYAWLKQKQYGDENIPHEDIYPVFSYQLSSIFNPGSIVIDKEGKVIGFVKKDGQTLRLSSQIIKIMQFVLGEEKFSFPTLGVNGWFYEERAFANLKDVKNGFLVTSKNNSKSALKVGDVILKINGVVLNPENIWYSIIGKEEVGVEILRNKEIIQLTTLVFKN